MIINLKDFFLIFCRVPVYILSVFFAIFSCSPPAEDSLPGIHTLDSSDAFRKFMEINEKIKGDPGNASLYFTRAQLFFDKKDLEATLNDVNRALKIDSSKAEFYLLLADIYFIKKEGINAKAVLNKCIEIDPLNSEAFLKLSEIYFLVDQYGKSIEYINQAIKVDKHNPKAYFMKGMSYKYNGDTANAISSMQTAIEQNNDYYDAFMQLGLLYGAKHDPLAVNYFDNALRVNPESTEAIYARSLFLQEHGQPEKAIEGYREIIQIEKNNYVAFFNAGFVYLVYLNKYPEAKENFSRAIELNPKYFEAYCNRGLAFEKMNDLTKARADFRKALEIKPDYSPAARGISRVVDKDFN